MAEDMIDLIDRLERAQAPSPELDALILCALAAPAGSSVKQSELNGKWCIYEGDDMRGRPRLWETRAWWRHGGWAVTESLDAAFALVERLKPDLALGILGRSITLFASSDHFPDEPASKHLPRYVVLSLLRALNTGAQGEQS